METPDVATNARKSDLHLADPLWLWQLAEGATRVLQGVLGAVVAALILVGVAIAMDTAGATGGRVVESVAGMMLPLATGLVLLVLSGLWSLTAAEPGQRHGSSVFRSGMLARAAMGGLLAATVVAAWVPGAGIGEDIAYLIAACVWVMLSAATACVAWRLRQAGAADRAKQAGALAWAFVMTPVLAALIAALWGWGMLHPPIDPNEWLSIVLVISVVVCGGALPVAMLFVLGKARREFARAAEEAWALRTPPATLQVDEHGHVAMDVPCRQCGYNLRGLEPTVACPECGAASKPSIDVHLLRAQDPIWPGQVAAGMTWLLVTLSASLAISVTIRVLFSAISWQGLRIPNWYSLISPISSLLSLGTLVGIWKITTPTFGSRQAIGERARKASRFCSWLRVVLTMRFPWGLSGGSMAFALTSAFVPGLLALIGWVALLRHCRRRAERASEPLLAERAQKTARQVAWLLGLSFALNAWMNVDNFWLSWIRAPGTATMPAGLSPWAVLHEILGWMMFGLHVIFTALMLRLAFAYRKRFRLITQSNETPGSPAGTGLDVSP